MQPQHEVEIKVLEIDRNEVEQILSDLRAEKIFDDVLKNTYFNPTDHLNVIRVRTQGAKTFLQVKHKIGNDEAKASMEYSTEVSSHQDMVKMLQLLGFTIRDEFEKHRTSYKFEDCRVEFDKLLGKYAHIPEFMEIESDLSQNVFRALEQLDIDKSRALTWSGNKVIEHYSKKSS